MTTMAAQLLASVVLNMLIGMNTGDPARNGLRISFVGFPHSCYYDLNPIVIDNSGSDMAICFQKPVVTGGPSAGHPDVTSSTPPFLVLPEDKSAIVNIGYSVQHTPSGDKPVMLAAQQHLSRGYTPAWWVHRIVLVDVMTDTEINVVDYRRFETKSLSGAGLPTDHQTVCVDLRPYLGRTLQFKYRATGFTFALTRDQQIKVATEMFTGKRFNSNIR